MKTLWNSSDGLSSRMVWDPIKDEISRASVINFLEEMTLNGLLVKHEITGKGGHRGIYQARYDETGTIRYLKRLFKQRLDQL